MFDSLDDAAVLDAMASASRQENAACGQRLAAIGELYARRAPEDDTERICWAVDGHANVVAEVSAALNISRGRAAGQLRLAIDLRERLPKVAEVFAAGAIDLRMAAELVNRTTNVEDPDLLARLDAALAERAPTWMTLSGPNLTERVDMWVERLDPTGVREPQPVRDHRYVEFALTSPGMVAMWAKLTVTEGAALDARIDNIAATVCRDDGRNQAQRRADALIALGAGRTRLECGCGSPDCPAAATAGKPLEQLVISVIADQATLDGRSDNPGYLPGLGSVPASLLRELAETAKLQPVPLPPPVCEERYRPSAALARFIRCRDLTCRFPGCDEPAEVCDIDHTIAYPIGPTHPSNCKLLCRFHHLLKTFHTGVGGWADEQLPDGTVVWTSPSGQVYNTTPAGADFFAVLGSPTGEFVIAKNSGPPPAKRTLLMPTRRRTRAQDRAYRIALERQHNAARIARKNLLLADRVALDDEPPPF